MKIVLENKKGEKKELKCEKLYIIEDNDNPLLKNTIIDGENPKQSIIIYQERWKKK